ncbi:MAG: alginate export family protein [bacterium]
MRKYFLLVFVFGLFGNLIAQISSVPIKFNGQIRVRSEVDGRDFNNDSDLNGYTLLRTRFGATIQPLKDVNVFVQIQDSRAFGQELNTLANSSNIDLHQAYFQINNLWNKPIQIKVGRQELIYGNERLIGAVGWSNVGRVFDGIKWTFGRKNELDLFGMTLNESDTPVAAAATPFTVAGREDRGNYFYGAYYKYRSNPEYVLDLYSFFELNLNETVPGEDDLNRATIGTYNNGDFSKNIDFETEVALQIGKRRGQDVVAFMFTGSVGYTFQTATKPDLRIGYDYLSGMNPDDEDYNVFDNLFGTNHKFYGYMDYFVKIPANTNNQGLQDWMVKATVPFAKKWNFNGHFHHFRAAKGVEKNFGNELDLILNYKYSSVASFIIGMSFFLPGDLMEQTFLNDDFGLWSYTTLLVNF